MNSCKDKEICAEKCESCGEEAVLDEYDKIYIQEMESWLEEQDIRADELKNSIDCQMKILDLNKRQLMLNLQRTKIVLSEYNDWRMKKNLKVKEPSIWHLNF